MIVQGEFPVFLTGCLGGLFNELLHWWNLREKPEFPVYARSAKYWTITVLMSLVGGATAWLYFGQRSEAILAVQVGLSTPLILQKLATSIPEPSGARGIASQTVSVRSFFKW